MRLLVEFYWRLHYSKSARPKPVNPVAICYPFPLISVDLVILLICKPIFKYVIYISVMYMYSKFFAFQNTLADSHIAAFICRYASITLQPYIPLDLYTGIANTYYYSARSCRKFRRFTSFQRKCTTSYPNKLLVCCIIQFFTISYFKSNVPRFKFKCVKKICITIMIKSYSVQVQIFQQTNLSRLPL